MQIIIHRGTHQIGGCATEIRTARTRILIDFGSELDRKHAKGLQVEGVTCGESSCDAVLFTHCHGDHIGLLNSIHADIPLYIGSLSKEMLVLSNERQRCYDEARIHSLRTFEMGRPFWIGDIQITPFVVDHSAFDSCMFLIKAEEKKILHTGDFRTHGFRGKGMAKVLDCYVRDVDLLICEGTTLNRSRWKSMPEYDLSRKAETLFKENKYIFIVCASTNIDRIAGFCRAVPRGKYCLSDKYQKDILDLVKEKAGYYSSLYRFRKILTYGPNFDAKMERRGFCMFVRAGNGRHRAIMERYRERNPLVLYSMWKGYLEEDTVSDFVKDFRMEILHTSGHADSMALKMLIEKTRPKQILPIHTEAPEELRKVCKDCCILSVKDKEVITI